MARRKRCGFMPVRQEVKLIPVTAKINQLAGQMFEVFDDLFRVVCYIEGYNITFTREGWLSQQEEKP